MIEQSLEALTKAVEANTAALNALMNAAKTTPAEKAEKAEKPAKAAKAEAKKDEPKAEAKKADAEGTKAADISDDDLRAAFHDYMGAETSEGFAERKDKAKAVIAENGGKKIVDIPKDRRGIAMSQIKKLKETGKVNLMEDEGEDEL